MSMVNNIICLIDTIEYFTAGSQETGDANCHPSMVRCLQLQSNRNHIGPCDTLVQLNIGEVP